MDRKAISIKEIYSGTQEIREYEFKKGFIWNHPTGSSLMLIKSVIAMSNSPSGGVVLYGINQNPGDSKINEAGLNSQEVQSFETNEESIKIIINSYISTNIAPQFLLLEDKPLSKTFMTISVSGYREYPSVIKKDGVFKNKNGEDVYKFRIGDILTRSIYPPYSSDKASQEELNEIIELCAKGVKKKAMDILGIKETDLPKKKSVQDKLKEERKDEYGVLES